MSDDPTSPGPTSPGPTSPNPTSRRGWLRSLVPAAAEAARELKSAARPVPPPPPRRRPPGAVAERRFLAGCTGCNDCVKACPENAIFSLAPDVSPGAGTPVMRPAERPCTMCDGTFPCVSACPEGVLEMPQGAVWRLGLVQIDTARCLPFRGPECGACARLCPEGARGALTLRRGRPVIDPELCVGCGLCIDACITTPSSIQLSPLSSA